jgi:DNA-directed RNA polymerase specialized sigma24 family protein
MAAVADLQDERQQPDDALMEAQRRKRIRDALQAISMDVADADLAWEVLVGERKPADVAKCQGVPVARVYQATARVRSRMSRDMELYDLWRER